MQELLEAFTLTAKKILFICVHNSGRSQMAEGLVNHFLGDTWEALSAGTKPSGYVHAMAVQAMAELSIDISTYRSKSADEFRDVALDRVPLLHDVGNTRCRCRYDGEVDRVVHVTERAVGRLSLDLVSSRVHRIDAPLEAGFQEVAEYDAADGILAVAGAK